MKTNKHVENEFHAVEFMRQVRSEMAAQFLQDKKKYLNFLKEAMEDFKKRQKKNND
jgi:hypothetical protein